MDLISKHYPNLDFDDNNTKYIFYEEYINKKGKKYDYYKLNNINNISFYSPSCNKLYDLLKKIQTKNKKIIDIGCGKGYALYIFSLFDFEKISGIEIDEKLVLICKKNFLLLNKKNISIIHDNILNLENINNYDIYYFYNPFNSNIFEKIIKKIKYDREIIIIYKNIHIEEKLILSKYKFNNIMEFKGNLRNYYIYKFYV